MAPRILHYGREQLLWECRELDACETYPEGVLKQTDRIYPEWFRLGKHRVGIDSARLESFDTGGEVLGGRGLTLKPDQRESIYRYWKDTVRAYTRCDLTKAEDKLVAISGLARRVQSLLGDEYSAGLWKRALQIYNTSYYGTSVAYLTIILALGQASTGRQLGARQVWMPLYFLGTYLSELRSSQSWLAALTLPHKILLARSQMASFA